MLKQRVLTAVVMLLVLAIAAALGTTAFLALTAAVLGVACFEWLRLAGLGAPWPVILGTAFALVAFGAAGFGALTGPAANIALLVSGAVWLLIALLLFRHEASGARLPRWLVVIACPLLLATAWVGFARLLAGGYVFLVSALALVWVADIAAYFAGRAFGKRKLAPRISPGKTWAGVGGAVIAVLALAAVVSFAVPQQPIFSTRVAQHWGIGAMMLALLLLVALSIVGDLFESLLKRQAGVKDSSGLLPGHGGVFDRIDALLPVLPVAALISAGFR